MDESNVIELLESLSEKMEGTIYEKTIMVTAELIKEKCGMPLDASQVRQCIDLCASADLGKRTLAEQLLLNNGLTQAKIEKIDMCANVLTNLDDIISLFGNLYDIYDMVDKHLNGYEVATDYALYKALNTLSDAVGLFTSCNFVSSILSLGADILEKGAKLVAQRNKYYEELDAILDDVINGTSTSEQEDLIIDIYKSFKLFEGSGSFEAMKLYNAIMTEYGWMFALAGVDMAKLNQYNVEFREIRDAYSDMNSKMYDAERIDRNLNGVHSDYSGDGFLAA